MLRFGVIFSNDSDWHEQRKMFVNSLHKTGFRKAAAPSTASESLQVRGVVNE